MERSIQDRLARFTGQSRTVPAYLSDDRRCLVCVLKLEREQRPLSGENQSFYCRRNHRHFHPKIMSDNNNINDNYYNDTNNNKNNNSNNNDNNNAHNPIKSIVYNNFSKLPLAKSRSHQKSSSCKKVFRDAFRLNCVSWDGLKMLLPTHGHWTTIASH